MNMHILLPLLLLCYGGVANIHCSRVDESNQDLGTLLHFKQGITSDPHGALSNWNTSSHFCRWNGVTCTLTQPYRVWRLDLSGYSLSGQISSFLGNLTFIHKLHLSANYFTGPLPLLGCLQHLRQLCLDGNSLSGIIPNALTNCSNLIYLDLSSNLLVGLVTPKFGLLSNLRYLRLSSNQLEGRIPDELGQLVNLETLDLSDTRLSGEVPHAVFSLPSPCFPILGNNMLGKALPPNNTCERLPNLRWLSLANNTLEGPIPASLANALGLQDIDLSHNKFTGQIPTAFGNLSHLEFLYLEYNQLMARNNQDWAFLSALQNCRSLYYLSVSYNDLQGPIPQSIGNLSTTSLGYLELAGNNLSGYIPRDIGNLSALFSLDLSENNFKGTIERLVDNLTQLEHLIGFWFAMRAFRTPWPPAHEARTYMEMHLRAPYQPVWQIFHGCNSCT